MTPQELVLKLNEHLPEPLFEELTRYVDQGDMCELYNEMAELDMARHPEEYTSATYEVEYDLSYTGGSYSGVGQFVSVVAVSEGHVPSLFKKQTGIDTIHIVSICVTDELYEKD